MTMFLDTIAWLSLISGSIFLIIGSVGLLRFPDLFTRLHAAGVIDTTGCILIIFGLMLQAGFTLITVKLFFIMIFILFTSPTATHALAKAALHGNVKPFLSEQGNDYRTTD